jgi:hypothetical protein
MAKSSASTPLDIARATAVISLGLVALAGSLAAALYRRIMTAPAGSGTSAPRISKLVLDEWEADLSRLNLPSRSEVEALQHQIAELEAQIDQLIQYASHSMEGDEP